MHKYHYCNFEVLTKISRTLLEIGEFERAFEYTKRSLDCAQFIYPEHHPTVAVLSIQLSKLSAYLVPDPNVAFSHLETALNIVNTTYPEGHRIYKELESLRSSLLS